MEELSTRYSKKLILSLMACTLASFLLSLVLLQAFTGALVLLWLFERDKKKAIGKVEIAFGIFIAARLLSVAFSQYPSLSLEALYKDALFYLGFYAFSFYLKVIRPEDIFRLNDWIIFSACLVSLYGIITFGMGLKERASSITSGYATFATYLLVPLAILLFNGIDNKLKGKFAVPVIASILLTGLAVALGRADFGVALFILIASLVSGKIKWTTFLLILVMTGAFSAGSFSLNKKGIAGRVKEPTTMSDRDVIWKTAFDRSMDHPVLGFGPRTFSKVFTSFDKMGDKKVGGWHSDLISVYMESGIIGLLALFYLVFSIYFNGIFKIRHCLGLPQFMKIRGPIWGATAMLMSALMSGFINSPTLSVLFAYLLAQVSFFIYLEKHGAKPLLQGN